VRGVAWVWGGVVAWWCSGSGRVIGGWCVDVNDEEDGESRWFECQLGWMNMFKPSIIPCVDYHS
jgi:hypothetical protein